jgi:hypothetical protein
VRRRAAEFFGKEPRGELQPMGVLSARALRVLPDTAQGAVHQPALERDRCARENTGVEGQVAEPVARDVFAPARFHQAAAAREGAGHVPRHEDGVHAQLRAQQPQRIAHLGMHLRVGGVVRRDDQVGDVNVELGRGVGRLRHGDLLEWCGPV